MMKPLLWQLILAVSLVTAPLAADYVIGEGDGLDISVWGVKDLNVAVRVRPDGKVTLPGLGEIVASGHTPKELQVLLATKLKDLVKNPIVTVSVGEITNSKVYIFGGGVKSGVYELTKKTTLLQLLCSMGEVRAADLNRAYVLRQGQKVNVNFHKLFIKGEVTEDVPIETNDVIFIPELLERNVYVLGAVNTPRFIEYRDGMTAMEAILEAGGFTKFAKENDTIIFRREGGKEITIPVRAKTLIKDGNLDLNVLLRQGDYVVVKEGLF
jgi:polysaccharide export outer membrane protein